MSACGNGTLLIEVEPYAACIEEIRQLMPVHYAECRTDPVPLEIDLGKYRAMDAAKLLHVVTARSGTELVGYYTSIVMPHIQHKTSLTAYPDMLYMKPTHRNGFTLMRMIRTVEDTLRARGVHRMFTGVTVAHDFGPLLERLGFRPIERLYSKMLG